MFLPQSDYRVRFDAPDAPSLVVVVDTEEEFPWDAFSSSSTAVQNIAEQHHAQAIMNRFGVKPTYAVDFPVASQSTGYGPLKEWLDDGLCDIGAQLHAWVTPPHEEEVCVRNTFQCNLPSRLERAKLLRLTEQVRESFGVSPLMFKAGRHGYGRRTGASLIELGYGVDNSVLPYADFVPHAPQYVGSPNQPYWLDADRNLLEMPMSAALVGAMKDVNEFAALTMLGRAAVKMKIPAVLARLGLLERIRLTPEGIELDEAKRLTMHNIQAGQRLFVLCYHSSSLLPGGNPYVRTLADRDRFVAWLEDYLTFFFGSLGGRATTPAEVHAYARAQARPAPISEAVILAAQ